MSIVIPDKENRENCMDNIFVKGDAAVARERHLELVSVRKDTVNHREKYRRPKECEKYSGE